MDGQGNESSALFHHGLRRRLLMMLRDTHFRGVTVFVILNKRIVTGYCIFLGAAWLISSQKMTKKLKGPWI